MDFTKALNGTQGITHPKRLSVAIAISIALTSLLAAPTTAATPTCAGTPATIVGTPGNDVLIGTADSDVIAGLGGDDYIVGAGVGERNPNAELLCGGAGNDTILGSPAGPNDPDLGSQTYGGAGNDRLYGTTAGDNFWPGPGDDLVVGGGNNDNVLYLDAPKPMVVDLRSGYATGQGHDRLIGIHTVIGAANQRNRLYGDAGPNLLVGGNQADRLYGRAGGDQLDGGTGRDIENGGPGWDVCHTSFKQVDCEESGGHG